MTKFARRLLLTFVVVAVALVLNQTALAAAWVAGANTPTVLIRNVGVFFPANGKFYTVGGRTSDAAGTDFQHVLEFTGPDAPGSWVQKAVTLPDNNTNNMACGVLTVSGTARIYCVGGSLAGGTTATARVFFYDPVADSATTLTASDNWPGNLIGSILPGGFAVANNKLYIIGGFNINVAATNQIWEFDPNGAVGSKWTQKVNAPVALMFAPATTIGGIIYVGGASDYSGGLVIDTTNSFSFNPTSNTIGTIAAIPRATGETRALTLGGKMYVLGGGRVAPNPSNEVDIYDPVGNSWSTGIPFTTRRRNFAADTDGTRIFIADGYASDGLTPLNSLEIFSPNVLLTENFDGVTAPALPAGWTTSFINGDGDCTVGGPSCALGTNWATDNTSSDTAPNSAFHNDPSCVTDSVLVSPTVSVAGPTQLTFRHRFITEAGFDGGVLEIKIGGGAFTDIITAGGSFVTGGYNSTISPSFLSPIAGRQAWSGDSGGYITTTVNLPASASGQNVQFQWRMASDCSISHIGGWNVDSVNLFSTGPTDLSVTKTDAPDPVNAGNNITYTITLTNNGPNDAANVTLTENPGTGTSLVSFQQTSGPAFNIPSMGGGPITASRSTFANGATATFTMVVQTNAGLANGATITNTATVSAANTDPNPANNTATATTTVVTPPPPPLTFFVGLDVSNNLVRFTSSAPGTITSAIPITGLHSGEHIVAIDRRPATGQIYGLSDQSRLYTINLTTGAATQVGIDGAFTLNGTTFGFDFNPVVDRIRVISNTEQNLRLNPNDGTLTSTDNPLAYAAGDPNAGQSPDAVGAAYTNNVAGATGTTLYDIDANLDVLVTQNPPNNGTLNTVGPLGVNTVLNVGLDINTVGATNTAFAALLELLPGSSRTALYTVDLSSGQANFVGNIGNGGTGILGLTILPMTLSVNNVSVAEGNSGSSNAVFTVTLSDPSSQTVTVDYFTSNGTATAPSDYQTVSGTLTFAPGQTTKTITVPVNGDTLAEPDETFLVNLINVTNAVAGNPGIGTITNDDAGGVLEFSQSAYSVAENAGTATITVNRSGSLVGTVTVNFATSNGTATAGSDYGNTSGTLTFGPGVTSQTFTVPIIDDALAEPTETLNLILTGPTGSGTLGPQSTAVLSILDNESAQPDVFAVTTNNNLLRFVSNMPEFIVSTVPITGLQASENVLAIDFRPATGQLYALGSTGRLYTINTTTGAATQVGSGTFTLTGTDFGFDFNPIVDRIRVVSDADQNFRLNPNDGTVTATDSPLTYASGDVNFGANPNVTDAAYTNDLGGTTTTLYDIDSNLDVLVRQGSPDGTPTSPNSGQLSTIGPLLVNTTGLTGFDIRQNSNTAYASFTDPGATASKLYTVNLQTGAATFQGTIDNTLIRDIALVPIQFQFGAASATVNEGAGAATITVTRSGDVGVPAAVGYQTSDTAGLQSCTIVNGKASERCDYVTSIGTLSFAAGETSKTFTIPIEDDVWVEGPETFNVSLTSANGGGVGSTSTITIVDNDSSPPTSNPIDGVNFFVNQQYLDFLGRLPDPIGFQNWVNTLAPCPNGGFGEPPTSNCDRLHVVEGFLLSNEFFGRGYFVFRFYMVSFNTRPTYTQFIRDMAFIGGAKTPAEEEAAKVAYANAFVQRPEFLAMYPGLSGQPLANALLATAGLPAGSYTAGSQTNGQILRGIAESSAAFNKFLTEGTVSALYFALLRRDPDTIGYQNNVNTLNANPSNLRHMIFIFIYSTEYRQRFGPS